MAGRVSSPVFVGRTGELERLIAAGARLGEGETVAALVRGEAGVGKSRLVREASARLGERGVRILAGACLPFASDPLPFAPIVEALRPLPDELDRATFTALVGEWRSELAVLMPALGPTGTSAMDGPGARGRIFELTLGFLRRLAASRPILLIVEDIQWADPSSLELLAFLVRSARGSRVAVVATYRTGELPRQHPTAGVLAELERNGWTDQIELRPLDRIEIGAQLRGILGAEPDHDLVARVFERGEGNPFFTEELIAGGSAAGLPSTLRDLLLARVDGRPESTRSFLRVAAVGGLRIATPFVSRVLGRSAEQVLADVRDAVSHGILVPDESLGRERYRFRHALIQEAIIDDVLPEERRALHRAFGEVLADRRDPGDPAQAAELAYHWSNAGDDARAYPAHVEAGRAAAAVAAFPEAERQYRQAIAIWERLGGAPAPGVDASQLFEQAARAADANGDPARAVADLRRALALVDARADPIRAGLLHARLARHLGQVAVTPEMLAEIDEAVRLVPPEPPSVARATVLATRSAILNMLGRLEDALVASDAAIAAAEPVLADAALTRALMTKALSTGYLGSTAAAIEAGIRARDLAISVDDPELIGAAYWNLAYMQGMYARQWRDAIATALAGVAEAERVGRLFASGTGAREMLSSAAYSAWASGQWQLADEILDRARDLGIERIETGFAFLYHDVRALLALARGQHDEAARYAEVVRRIGGANQDPAAIGESGRIPAELELALGRPVEASASVAAALARLEGSGASPDADDVGELLATGARVEAEVALTARAERDGAALDGAFARGAAYVERLRTLHAEFERNHPGRARVTAAFLHTAEAELARLAREPADWLRVIAAWHDLDEPYREALARYRQAEAALAARRRATGGAALDAAREIAERLGATVLLADIEALARRARIPLGGSAGTPRAAGTNHGLGLTRRELEVLGLLVDGRTNREIGEQLFITEKTASVHVSNILGKLGAVRRTEAAAIARRSGLA